MSSRLLPEKVRSLVVRTPGAQKLAVLIGGVVAAAHGEARCRVGHETCIHLDLRDRIQRMMWFRVYEPATLALLEHFLPTGSSFLDVGAHIGYLAAFAALRVGESGRVYAFEPDPVLYEQLSMNLRPWPWACAVRGAVGDRDEPTMLWRSPSPAEFGWGTTVRPVGEDRTAVQVPGVSLDIWASRHYLTRPVVLKVDVEGAESRVFRGARGLLQSDVTRAVLVEVNPVCLGRDKVVPADLVAMLRDSGFRLRSYASSGRGPHDMLLATRSDEAIHTSSTLRALGA